MNETDKHVLVVDDEAQVRDLTRRALVTSGFRCDVAEDGEEALRMASANKYDAVVTDLRMPRRHGHALCSELMRLPERPSVIVLTALSDPRLVRDLMQRGVCDIIQKPVNYDVLAAKVGAILQLEASRQVKTVPKKPAKSAARKINLLHQIESSLVELTDLCGERLDAAFEQQEELAEPPRSIRDFIRRLAESEASGADRDSGVEMPGHQSRSKERVTCFLTAIARPVDRTWAPTGEPFKLALRDLSESGVRLLHTRATNAEFLALCWNATQLVARQVRVVCDVRRCKPCGPFYDIGGQFVMAD